MGGSIRKVCALEDFLIYLTISTKTKVFQFKALVNPVSIKFSYSHKIILIFPNDIFFWKLFIKNFDC